MLHEQVYGVNCLYVNTFDEMMVCLICTTYTFEFKIENN